MTPTVSDFAQRPAASSMIATAGRKNGEIPALVRFPDTSTAFVHVST
jgi:hypothetical protein